MYMLSFGAFRWRFKRVSSAFSARFVLFCALFRFPFHCFPLFCFFFVFFFLPCEGGANLMKSLALTHG